MNRLFTLNHIKAASFAVLASLALCAGLTAGAQEKREWGKWDRWGDLGNGTYLNPVIPADYSDLDCIRVGDDYYAITSTFQFSPGMTIIHSTDLVNWRIAGNAVPDLTQIGIIFSAHILRNSTDKASGLSVPSILRQRRLQRQT